jgi:hypothetical protein
MVSWLERAALLVCLATVSGGCRGKSAGTAHDATAPEDTGAMGGLTPDQIKARADSMSPARAESLGIVDTTIHVEAVDSSAAIITRSTKPLSSEPPADTTSAAPKP